MNAMTEQLGKRFSDLVRLHRKADPDALAEIATARVFLAEGALSLGLVDGIGYMPDALQEARNRAGLPANARVVVYRRNENPNDNIYNPVTSHEGGRPAAWVDLGLPRLTSPFQTGFYYLWLPAAE